MTMGEQIAEFLVRHNGQAFCDNCLRGALKTKNVRAVVSRRDEMAENADRGPQIDMTGSRSPMADSDLIGAVAVVCLIPAAMPAKSSAILMLMLLPSAPVPRQRRRLATRLGQPPPR
jgi:hypothetical protein